MPGWQNLQNSNTRDGIRIVNLGICTISCRQNNINLSSGWQLSITPSRDLLNLQVTRIAPGLVRLHIVDIQSAEQHSIHLLALSNQASLLGVLVRGGEGDRRGAGGVWVLRRLESEGWEGLEWEGGVAGGEAGDELGGEGEDLVEVEGGVEGFWEGNLFEDGADVGAVAGLDGQNGAGGSEIPFINNGLCGAWMQVLVSAFDVVG